MKEKKRKKCVKERCVSFDVASVWVPVPVVVPLKVGWPKTVRGQPRLKASGLSSPPPRWGRAVPAPRERHSAGVLIRVGPSFRIVDQLLDVELGPTLGKTNNGPTTLAITARTVS